VGSLQVEVCRESAGLEGGRVPRVRGGEGRGGVRALIGLFIEGEIGQLFGFLHNKFAFGLLEF
jgi:hypothetical protein